MPSYVHYIINFIRMHLTITLMLFLLFSYRVNMHKRMNEMKWQVDGMNIQMCVCVCVFEDIQDSVGQEQAISSQ